MSLPCNLNDETNLHASIFVCTAETIYYKQALVWKLFLSYFLNSFPCFLTCTVVIIVVFLWVPPHCIMRCFIINDELILRRTAGIDTCLNVDSAKFCLLTYLKTFETFFCLFIKQHLIRRVVKYFCSTCNAVLLKYWFVKLCHFLNVFKFVVMLFLNFLTAKLRKKIYISQLSSSKIKSI